ncbi:MAG: hypothetical protein FJ026_12145, partial [Chloroflexi bacterium]|nr:hypothetical protein [Chloroflexota bacterium]
MDQRQRAIGIARNSGHTNGRVLLLLVLCGLALGLAALYWPLVCFAQQTIKDVAINLVEVTRLSNLRSAVKAYVTVTDLDGVPIKGLGKDNFTVTEDGSVVPT